jgi:hypothetical protein
MDQRNVYSFGSGRNEMKIGHGSPDNALTLAYMPLGVFIAALLAGLFSFAFQLGFTPPLISLGLLALLIVAVGVLTGQLSASAAAGTRLTLAHMGLVCLLGGVAAAPPAEFPPLMLWSLTAIAAAATGILVVEAWITEKIDAAGPFSRQLGREAYGLLVLSVAVLLWRSGKVDSWVVVAGAIHYVGLLLSLVMPLLRQESPAVWRPYIRIAMTAALIVALAPIAPPIAATVLGAAALGLALAGAAADISTAGS